ncbi:hypothetical protein CDV36_010538 [Fusarium kuroshium]|uniref:Clr5 domain-containing protein n=1 Tax=Fusarium kuroshium TaxID=2010991 RepID=A0A3M2RX34_9HYPO|nr:hypothetical protein CDV36_010538 [Fusarium kuroshium]
MDPSLIGPLPQSDDEKFLSCSYEDRWSCLKPVIVEIYTRRRNGRTATLDQVVQFMRTQYSFHAAPTEYRRRFRDWGVSKRMVKEDKDAITSALVKRKRPAASVSDATTQHDGKDKPLDYKKLKRHLISRKPCLEIAPGLLSSCNLPYAAFVSSLKHPGEPSPFGSLRPTPDYLHIQSPEALTPGRAAAGPSPRMQLVYEKHKEHCTSLFMQGRFKQLVVSMSKEDRSTMVNYFHDFYMHSFILAKNWGRELSNLNPTQAFALTPQTRNTTSPWTPSAFLNLPSSPSSPQVLSATDVSCPPTQLCKWSIHLSYGSFVYDNSVPATAPSDTSILPHPELSPSSFVESLHQSMASNDFTSTPKADLPLAQDMIAKSLEEDPSPLQLDAWKLAIMAGNIDLLHQLHDDNGEAAPEDIEAIHPLHLAAAFLDGGHQCCSIFGALSWLLPSSFAFYNNVDDHGHTILDALVVTVLRSHTSLYPSAVSSGFHSSNRFPGEEKDICGRWDADTETLRELFKQGYARIPNQWKHPFCHTAVQAVCHSIVAIYASPASPSINAQSGLFVRRCMECGLELKLGPIHTLVVAAFYLAQLGMPGETLFGALAIMVCLITLGANVSIQANISVEDILRSSDAEQCRHTPLSPLDLMMAVPGGVVETWSEDCRIGWSCLIQTLKLAMTEEREELRSNLHVRWASPLENECPGASKSSSSKSSDHHPCDAEFKMEFHDDWLKLPCNGPRMGLLWASVQTELLTYRRLSEGEAWISGNFSMKALKTWLEGESPEFLTPLVQNRMFKTHTRCGWFKGAGDFLCATTEEVCKDYFMNMDIYNRASYIQMTDILRSFISVEHVQDGTV